VAPGGRYAVTLSPHQYTGTCGGAGAEAYFTFTLTATSDVFLATHQTTGINTYVYVRNGTCAGTQVNCNNDADGLTTSRLTLTNLAAGTYTVFVDTASGVTSGNVTLDAYITTPGIESERCGNPTILPAGTTSVEGSNSGYFDDYIAYRAGGGPCPFCASGNGPERVYAFYIPTARSVTFNGCGGTTNFDTTAYIRTVCTSDGVAATQPVCDDDDGCNGGSGACGTATQRSSITAILQPGLYYFFADALCQLGPPVTCQDGGGSSAFCPCAVGNYTYAVTGL
jgi:hypothetical protein